jgi:hypothetical protein
MNDTERTRYDELLSHRLAAYRMPEIPQIFSSQLLKEEQDTGSTLSCLPYHTDTIVTSVEETVLANATSLGNANLSFI